MGLFRTLAGTGRRALDGFEKWLLASFKIVLGGQATAEDHTLETIAEGLNAWSIAELPNGGLITERPGGLKHVDAECSHDTGVPPVLLSHRVACSTSHCIHHTPIIRSWTGLRRW